MEDRVFWAILASIPVVIAMVQWFRHRQRAKSEFAMRCFFSIFFSCVTDVFLEIKFRMQFVRSLGEWIGRIDAMWHWRHHRKSEFRAFYLSFLFAVPCLIFLRSQSLIITLLEFVMNVYVSYMISSHYSLIEWLANLRKSIRMACPKP